MAEQAFRNRWPMTVEKRQSVIDRLTEVLETSEKPREIIAAARALIAAEAQNQTDEHKILDKLAERRIAELDQVAAELGLDQAIVEGIANEVSGDTGAAEV